LPTPGGSQDHHVLAMLDEVAGGQGLELLLVEGGLVAEVKALQPLHEGEAGHVGAHGDVLGRLGLDLLGEDALQEVGVGELFGAGVLEEGFEALPALEEPEPLEVVLGGARAGRRS